MIGLVLAAGAGRRLGPETNGIPKTLLHVRGSSTILDIALGNLAAVDLSDVAVVVGYAADAIRRRKAELEERHTFLTDQLADLESSRRELRHVVAALDEEIQGRFDAAFEEVARAYEEHFALLFPGGKGKLRLTDPSEP
ncbi:MAG: NTP transferase domain-containing protein, partial [Gammaproteobacteria bacterium]